MCIEYLSDISTVFHHFKADVTSLNTCNKPDPSVQPEEKGTPVRETRDSILLSSSKATSCSPAASTPGTAQLPVGSQTLQDLMELTEEGITLTQYGNHVKGKYCTSDDTLLSVKRFLKRH